jgi:nuclear transcription factor Y alpha
MFSLPVLVFFQACVSYPYGTDPYYGGVLTGYTSHAFVHPQITGAANSRMPLPVDPSVEEPIFVNAKQYNAILRRRQTRAKLEAQNKAVKGRKVWLKHFIFVPSNLYKLGQCHIVIFR